MMNNWLIGGGVIAGVTALWGYIKIIFSYIRSLIVVRAKLENCSSRRVLVYVNENFKRLKCGDKNYNIWALQHKETSCCREVACVEIFQHGFFRRKWYEWIHIGEEKNDPKKDVNSDTTIRFAYTISYIRGTVDVENILYEAVEQWQNNENGINNDRYSIIPKIGTIGNATNQDNTNLPSEDPKISYAISKNKMRSLIKIIGFELKDFLTDEDIDNKNRSATGFLALNQHVLDMVKEIGNWLKSKEWYIEKSIPWKRGWLLYGSPGTGKTSLVRAIAKYHGIPVYTFYLSTFTDKCFLREWNVIVSHTPCIALIEDIDTCFNGRTNMLEGQVMGQKPMGFNTLLNCIDGIDNSDGIFTIITTNNPERLDSALGKIEIVDGVEKHITRPGRIDNIIKLDVLDEECRTKIANRILIDYPEFITQTVKDGVGETGAQFQDRCSKLALKQFWENGGMK